MKKTDRLNRKKIFTLAECAQSRRGESYMETLILLIVSVVVGSLVIGGIYTLFDTVLLPEAAGKIGRVIGA